YKKYGRCVIAVSEGIQDAKGVAIATKFTKEVDSHGNVQLSGTGALGDLLAKEIKAKTSISRVRSDTFGYLQRSFPASVSAVDAREGRTAGQMAVREACKGHSSGSIAIKRAKGKKYKAVYERVALKDVARDSREMPSKFINKQGNDVTKAFIEYALPLVGKLPYPGRLKGTLLK
ncbi:6-phosphofructokinase, partial [bacterium E08(2017)]